MIKNKYIFGVKSEPVSSLIITKIDRKANIQTATIENGNGDILHSHLYGHQEVISFDSFVLSSASEAQKKLHVGADFDIASLALEDNGMADTLGITGGRCYISNISYSGENKSFVSVNIEITRNPNEVVSTPPAQ